MILDRWIQQITKHSRRLLFLNLLLREVWDKCLKIWKTFYSELLLSKIPLAMKKPKFAKMEHRNDSKMWKWNTTRWNAHIRQWTSRSWSNPSWTHHLVTHTMNWTMKWAWSSFRSWSFKGMALISSHLFSSCWVNGSRTKSQISLSSVSFFLFLNIF